MGTESKKITGVHLLNDYSGSPRVFAQVLKMLAAEGYEITLFTSNPSVKGFLSDLNGLKYAYFFYRRSRYPLITLASLMFSQIVLFFKLLWHIEKGSLMYINTILPFAAALAAKVRGVEVLYHVHETSVSPPLFKRFLFSIVKFTATDVIYVSQALADREPLSNIKSHVVYNSVAPEFFSESENFSGSKEEIFTVLMLSSMKLYKGIYEFVALAKHFREFQFKLVLNATQKEVDLFKLEVGCPRNCTVYASQRNVIPFYKNAHVVLNLSHPDKWVETFGLTAVEAMCFGIPVIVPPVGGIAELVENDVNGYCIDVRHLSKVKAALKALSEDQLLYHKLSSTAKKKSMEFQPKFMYEKLKAIIDNQYE